MNYVEAATFDGGRNRRARNRELGAPFNQWPGGFFSPPAAGRREEASFALIPIDLSPNIWRGQNESRLALVDWLPSSAAIRSHTRQFRRRFSALSQGADDSASVGGATGFIMTPPST